MSRRPGRLNSYSHLFTRPKTANRRQTSQLNIEPLDPRILLDASGLLSPSLLQVGSIQIEPVVHESLASNETSSTLENRTAHRHEVVFVDAGADQNDVLLSELRVSRPGVFREVIELAPNADGLEQIAKSLSNRTNVDAIHILSHGDRGQLLLGNSTIQTDSLTKDYRGQLSAIGDSLTEDGDILIYGCDLGGDAAGEAFVRTFSELTSADVAASDDVTGHQSLGGDWDLEVRHGVIETEVAVSQNGQSELMVALGGVPTATLSVPAEEMINEDFSFSVSFDNTSTTPSDVGYAPYADLSVPDGFVLNSANYLGSAVTMFNAGVFDSDGILVDSMTMDPVNHPILGTPVTGGTPGETLYVIELPFGSFTPGQPAADIDINATLDGSAGAVVGTPLSITATGGFAIGCDPFDNPGTDPPVAGASSSDSITPTVINLIKDSNAPEDERSTGPNFPFEYTLTIDVANGETITNLDITDALPNSFVYVASSVNVNLAGGVAATGQSITQEPVSGSPQNAPNNDFLIEFDSVTGTSADNDIEVTYTVYIERDDADSNPVINANSGNDVPVTNDGEVAGTYNGNPIGDDDAETDFTLVQKSIAVQKGVSVFNDTGAAGATPGDTLEYTINLQVSDYFEFGSVVIDDTFSDGQRFDTSFTPTFSINEGGANTSGSFNAANYGVTLNSPGDGSTDVHFDLYNEVPDGVLTGDLFADAAVNGGTTVTVRFRTVIQEDFSDTFPTGDSSVDARDILTNTVTTLGTLPSGQTEADGSGASISIVGPSIHKANYAIDGSTAMANDEIAVGHTMTYRIQFDMSTADMENLVISDFMPLPIFQATEITAFDNSGPSATAPAAGFFSYGPNHTLHTVVPATDPPAFSTDVNANSVSFNFGDFDVTPSVPATIDLLLTVTAQDVRFADGLFLTNQANASYGTTNNGSIASNVIVRTETAAPDLTLGKGIVSTNATAATYSPATVGPVAFATPGSGAAAFGGGINSTNLAATPIDSNLIDANAGDLVKFAIVVENSGQSDGFDVLIQDVVPAEYVVPSAGPGLNLQVRDGDGTAVPYTGAASDLFGAGIRIDDSGALQGGINNINDATAAGDGSNILVITYDLELATAVEPDQVYTNNATIAEYGAVDGGNDHTAGSSSGQWTDDATIETTAPVGTKSLISTSEAHTSGANVTVGEIVRYRLVAEVPEGTMTNLQFDDNLPTGMQFLDDGTANVAFVSNGGGITSNDIGGSLNLGLGTAPGVSGNAPVAPAYALPDHNVGSSSSTDADPDSYGNGTDPQFKFGEIVNADNDADSEYIVVEFNAIVMNVASVDADDTLTNTFDIRINGVSEDRSNSTTVTVQEPEITNLTKSVAPTTGDAGDTVSYTVTFSNTGNSNAYELTLSDALPAELALSLPSVSLTPAGGTSGVVNNSSGNTISFEIAQIPVGGSVSLTYDADLLQAVEPSELVQNTATIAFSGLPGANGTAANPTGSATPGASGTTTGERDGSGSFNDYADSSTASVAVDSPTVSKSLISTSIVNGTNANDEAVIGENAQYQVVVTLPEGTTNVAEVVDTLDGGLLFLSLDSISTSAGISSSNAVIDLNDASTIPTNVAGQVITYELGTLTNSNNDATPETITLTYTVRVRNSVGNQGEGVGTMLNNSARLAWELNGSDTQTGAASAEEIEVIEPALEVIKMVNSAAADAGDTVTFTMTVQHATGSDTDAFDVSFSDPVPAGINFTYPADVTAMHSTAGDISALFQQSGQTLQTIPGTTFDLLAGETATITITGTLAGSVTPGAMLSNTATTNWSSLDGTYGYERNGDDGAAGAPDNYESDSTASITAVNAPTIAKALVGTSIDNSANASDEVVIGETAQYRLTVTLPEATIPMSQVIDNLDLGLEFVSFDSLDVLSGGVATTDVDSSVGLLSNMALFNPTVTGNGTTSSQQLTFDFGTLTNNNRVDGDAETIVITYTARVGNIGGNVSNGAAAGTMLDNSATFNWNDGTARATAAADAADIEVIEPDLDIRKVVDDDTPRPGQTVTYTLTIDHTADSDADAHDLVISDQVPAQMLLDVASINVMGAPVVSNTSSANDINLSLDGLAQGGTITITYDATVSTNPANIAMLFNNTADISWTSLPGGSVNERDGSDGAAAPVDNYADSSTESATVTQPILNVAKQHLSSAPNATNSDNFDLTIRVVAKNDGNLDLSNLSLVEDLAAHFGTTFVGATPPSMVDISGLVSGGTAPTINSSWNGNLGGSGQTNLFDGSSGLLRPGEFVSIDFVVTIDPDAVGATFPMDNQVAGSANFTDDGMTQTVMDLSDDGTDPSGTNAGFPGDTGGMNDPNPLLIGDVGLAKAVVGTPTQLPNDNYSVVYELVLTNTGTTDLNNLQIQEDLLAEFGNLIFVGVISAPTITSAPSLAGSAAPDLAATTWDGNLGGSGNQNIFDGTSGRLVPSDSLTVRFTVEVNPDATGASVPLDNQAQAIATPLDPMGNPLPGGNVNDDSDSGTDPSSTNPTAPGDMMTTDDPTPLLIPDIGAVKQVSGDYVFNMDGTVTIPFELSIENLGTADLINLVWTDDVQSEVGAAVFNNVSNIMLDTSGVLNGVAPGLNGGWAGDSTANILDGTGTLAPGDSATLTFDLQLNMSALASSSPLWNQAMIAATDTSSTPVNDLSDDGNDPHGTNPMSPGDTGTEDDPTPIQIANIGAAKRVVGTPTRLANGNWSVNYELVIENVGSIDLENIQLGEDLEIEFGVGTYVALLTSPMITAGPSLVGSTAPTFLGTWDGGLNASGNVNMFDGVSGHLEPDDMFTIQFTVEIDPDASGDSSRLTNQVDVSGDAIDNAGNPIRDSSGTPITATDASDDGTNANGINAGSPGDLGTSDDPTPVELPEIGVAKQVNLATPTNIVGRFDVQYVLVVENTGTVNLTNLQVVEDVAAEFGAGFVGVQSAPMIVSTDLSGGASSPTVASTPAWDGTTLAANLFDGSSGLLYPGDSITLQYTVRIDATAGDTTAPNDWTNQVVASGDGITSNGNILVSDLSDDGANPNTDNGTGTKDDPTELSTPQIRAGKSYGTIVANSNGTYTVPVTILVANTGIADLSNVSLVEDIAAEFGNAFISVANPQITAIGTYAGILPQVNPSWTTADTTVDVIDPAQSNESMLIGDQFALTFDVVVDPDAVDDQSQRLMNQAMVSGEGRSFDGSTIQVTDLSGSPAPADPVGIDLDNPSELLIPEIRTTKVVTNVVRNGNNWNVTFDLVLENTGSTDLNGLDLFDDLDVQLGSQFVQVVNATLDDTTGVGMGVSPTLNFGGSAGATPFDGGRSGAASANLLNNDGSLTPGEFVTVTLTIEVDPDATGTAMGIVNQSRAFGDDPNSATEVSDLSDDGTNPNRTNPSSPVDTGGHNDPTPVDMPDISVVKDIVGTPAVQPNGNFFVTYRLIVENIGTLTLDHLQITEDIDNHFGPGILVGVTSSPAIVSGPSQPGSAAPNLAGNWDAGLDGNVTMFDGTSGMLVSGDSYTVEFSIEVDPDANGPVGTLLNQVVATGDDPLGTPVTDTSDGGTDPNTNNPDADGDMGTFDDPTPLNAPGINAAKQLLGTPTQVTTGSNLYDTSYEVVLLNTGNVTLDGLDLYDNLRTKFGAAFVSAIDPTITGHTLANAANLPTINPVWKTNTSQSMFNDDGVLAPGESITIRLDVVLDTVGAARMTLLNRVRVIADDPFTGAEMGPEDHSDDGTDPRALNTGSPGDLGTYDDPTPVLLPDATIGLSKNVADIDARVATLDFHLENIGNLTAMTVRLTDDLDVVFGAGNYTVDSISLSAAPTNGVSSLTVNPSFDGSGDQELLDTSAMNTLAVGDTATVRIEVTVVNFVDIDGPGPLEIGQYENNATVTSRDVHGNMYTDESTDGTNPDPNSDGDPIENDPTPIYVSTDATIGVAKSGTYNDANDTVVLRFYLEHLGVVEALNVSMLENLDAVYGAGKYTVGLPTLVSGPSSLNVNSTFNGSSVTELIGAGSTMMPGETADIQLMITVHEIVDAQLNGLGTYSNQVTVTANNSDGDIFVDASQNGTNPDPDGDDDPTNNNVPTPGLLTPAANVGIAKSAATSFDSTTVVFFFTFANFGNTVATNIEAFDDLAGVFGAGVPNVVGVTRPSGPSTFTANGTYNGVDNTNLVGIGSSLQPGEVGTIEVTVDITTATDGTYVNVAQVRNEDVGGNLYVDDSTDGFDPDENANLDPTDDSEPTPIVVFRGEVSGTVYADFNNNGVQDADEPGIPDVQITLDGVLDGVPFQRTAMTDADGNYIFAGLAPGDYSLTEFHPEAFIDGQDTAGSEGGTVADDLIQFSLAPGGVVAFGYNFGEQALDPFFVGKDPFLASGGSTGGGPGVPGGETESEVRPYVVDGQRVTVTGSPGDDMYVVRAGLTHHIVEIDFVAYSFPADQITEIWLGGGGGSDEVTIYGSSAAEQIELGVNRGELVASDYEVRVNNFESIRVDGGAGLDRAEIVGSSADETLAVSPHSGSLTSEGKSFEVTNVRSINAYANGGDDVAYFYDSANDDEFTGTPVWSRLRGPGYQNVGFGFEVARALSASGGHDVAILKDSAGDDRFVARPNNSSLRDVAGTFHNRVTGFDRVNAYATTGDDVAHMYDSGRDDRFVARPQNAVMRGENDFFYNKANKFDEVLAYASGGVDSATFYGSSSDEHYVVTPEYAVMRETSDVFRNFASGFEFTTAHESSGADLAVARGSDGDDVFSTREAYTSIVTGGGATKNLIIGFQNTRIEAAGGNDVAYLREVGSDGSVYGRDSMLRVSSARRNVEVHDMETAMAYSMSNQSAHSDVENVDYLFAQFGSWS